MKLKKFLNMTSRPLTPDEVCNMVGDFIESSTYEIDNEKNALYALAGFYKNDPEIRNLKVKTHFYQPDFKENYYFVGKEKGVYFGFVVGAEGTVYFSEIEKKKKNQLEFKDDISPSCTLGEIFDALE